MTTKLEDKFISGREEGRKVGSGLSPVLVIFAQVLRGRSKSKKIIVAAIISHGKMPIEKTQAFKR